MDNLIIFVLGMVVGWAVFKIHFYYKVWTMMKSVSESPSPSKPKVINIDLVRMKDRIYAYNRENNQFLAHGHTKDELAIDLKARFPDVSFMASPANLKEVGLE